MRLGGSVMMARSNCVDWLFIQMRHRGFAVPAKKQDSPTPSTKSSKSLMAAGQIICEPSESLAVPAKIQIMKSMFWEI